MKSTGDKNMAVIGYTQFYTDIRVVREAVAATEAGYTIDVYSLKEFRIKEYPGINVHFQNKEQYKGGNKIKFISSYLKFFFYCFCQLSIQHFRKKYEVIHVHNMPNFIVFCCLIPKIFGAKVILDIHDLVPELFAEKFNISITSFWIRLLYMEERISANYVDVLISTNRLITKRLRDNKIKKTFIPEILNAADDKIFTPQNNKKFSEHEIRVIFPSTIAKRLGLDILIDAIKLVYSKNDRVRLKIFGNGEYAESVLKRIRDENLQDFISFPGSVYFDALNLELEQAHIGVIPWPSGHSTNFQMPIKIHEYFIKGLCVVASDVNIVKEYFDGIVVLYKAGDSNDFAEKILHLMDHPDIMKKYSNQGHEYYVHNSWTFYKREYIRVLNNINLYKNLKK